MRQGPGSAQSKIAHPAMGTPSFDDLPPEVREYLSDDEGAF
jgi:hypothetical protein